MPLTEAEIRQKLTAKGYDNGAIDSFLQYRAAGGPRSQLGKGALTSQANIKPYQQPSDGITEFTSSIYNGLVPTLGQAVAMIPNLAVGWTGDNAIARGAEHVTNTAIDWIDNNLKAYVAPEANQGIFRLNEKDEIEFTDARSFMNGLGQGIGSLISFFIPGTAIAKGTKLSATAATMLSGTLISAPMIYESGRKAGLNNADNIRMTLALSPIIGAIELVGGIEAQTLSKIAGKETKETIKEIGEKALTESLEKFGKGGIKSADDFVLATKSGLTTLKGIADRLTNPTVIRNSIGEASEEYLQNVVQKAGEQLYDNFYGQGKEIGKGKYGTEILLPEGSDKPGIFGTRYNKRDFIDDFSSAIYGGILGYGMSAVTTPVVNQSMFGYIDNAVRKGKLPQAMQVIEAASQNLINSGKMQDAKPVLEAASRMAQVSEIFKGIEDGTITPAMRYDAYNWQYNERPIFEQTVSKFEQAKVGLAEMFEKAAPDTIAISAAQKFIADGYNNYRRSKDAITAINDHIRSLASTGKPTLIKQKLTAIASQQYDYTQDPEIFSLLAGLVPATDEAGKIVAPEEGAQPPAGHVGGVGADNMSVAQEQKPDAKLDALIGQPVTYRGAQGTIAKDDVDGYLFVEEGGVREHILGKGDLSASQVGVEFEEQTTDNTPIHIDEVPEQTGVAPAEDDEVATEKETAYAPPKIEGGKVTMNGKGYEVMLVNRDGNGNPISVRLKTEDGKVVTSRNQDLLLDVMMKDEEAKMKGGSLSSTSITEIVDGILAEAFAGGKPPHIAMFERMIDAMPDAVAEVMEMMERDYKGFPAEQREMVKQAREWMDKMIKAVQQSNFTDEQKQEIIELFDTFHNNLIDYYYALGETDTAQELDQQRVKQHESADKGTNENANAEQGRQVKGDEEIERPAAEVAKELLLQQDAAQQENVGADAEQLLLKPSEELQQIQQDNAELPANDAYAQELVKAEAAKEVVEQAIVEQVDELMNPAVTLEWSGEGVIPDAFLIPFAQQQENGGQRVKGENRSLDELAESKLDLPITVINNFTGEVYEVTDVNGPRESADVLELANQFLEEEIADIKAKLSKSHLLSTSDKNNLEGLLAAKEQHLLFNKAKRTFTLTNTATKITSHETGNEQTYQLIPLRQHSTESADEAAALDIIGTAMEFQRDNGRAENEGVDKGVGAGDKAGDGAADNEQGKQTPKREEGDGVKPIAAPAEEGGQGGVKKQERKTIEIDESKTIAQRYNESEHVYGTERDGTEIIEEQTLPDGTVRRVKIVLGEAFSITPSHSPFTFAKSEGFPLTPEGKTVNDNDYENSPEAQGVVIMMGDKFDGRALDSIPFVKDGIVYSGNNRTMSRQRSAQQGTDVAYVQALKQKAGRLGFDKSQVDKFEHPTVWYEIVDDVKPTTEEFRKYNQAAVKQKSPIERAVELGKLVRERPAIVSAIATMMEQYENLSAFYASKDAKLVFDRLQKEGIINQMERPRYIDADGNLTDSGKEFVESLMVGAVLSEDNVRSLNQDGNRSIRQRIVTAMKELTDNFKLDAYNILKDINNAIKVQVALNRDKQEGDTYEVSLQNYINKLMLFERQELSTEAILLNILLNKGERSFKEAMANYNQRAASEAAGQVNMFGGEAKIKTKDEVVKELLQYYNDMNKLSEAEKKVLTAYEGLNTEGVKIAVGQDEIVQNKKEIDDLLNFEC